MKKIYSGFTLMLFLSLQASSQVGIGTNSPSASAVLQLESTNKGFLPSRMTTIQRNGIASPANGLVIYNTTTNTLEYFNSALNAWVGLNGNLPLLDAGQDNYLYAVASTSNAYGFSVNNGVGTWTALSLGANSSITINSTLYFIIAYTPTGANAFYKNGAGAGVWLSQSMPSGSYSNIAGKNVIVVFNTTNAYAFYKDASGNGVWLNQAISAGASITSSLAPNDMVILRGSTAVYSFYFDAAGTGHWLSQPISGSSFVQTFSQ